MYLQAIAERGYIRRSKNVSEYVLFVDAKDDSVLMIVALKMLVTDDN